MTVPHYNLPRMHRLLRDARRARRRLRDARLPRRAGARRLARRPDRRSLPARRTRDPCANRPRARQAAGARPDAAGGAGDGLEMRCHRGEHPRLGGTVARPRSRSPRRWCSGFERRAARHPEGRRVARLRGPVQASRAGDARDVRSRLHGREGARPALEGAQPGRSDALARAVRRVHRRQLRRQLRPLHGTAIRDPR